MDPISSAIAKFQKEIHKFLQSEDSTFCTIGTSPEHTGMLCKVLRAEEWHAENRSPFVIINIPFTKSDEEIAATICTSIREQYATLAKGLAEEGVILPDFNEKLSHPEYPVDRIVAHLLAFKFCITPHLALPVFCWLPSVNKNEADWLDLIGTIMEVISDFDIKTVIAIEKEKLALKALQAYGDKGIIIRFSINNAAAGDYFERLFAKPAAGHAEGTPTGAAAPDVEPPPRKNAKPPSGEAVAGATDALDLPPMLSPDQADALRSAIFTAARAAARMDEETALREQVAACEICEKAGVKLEHALMRMTLANYYLQFKLEEEAMQEFGHAETIAADLKNYTLLSQVRLARASIHMRRKKRIDNAIEQYEQAAAAAAIGESWLLYLESLRMAGTCHIRLKDTESAMACWSAAVKRGAAMDKWEVKASSFLEIANRFVELLRKNSLDPQADSVETLIAEMNAQESTVAGGAE